MKFRVMKTKKSLLVATFAATLAVGVFMTDISVGHAQNDDPLMLALANRHMTQTTAQLEQIAGGQDKLVARLLQLRTEEKLSYVAVRAEKILLSYSARPEVADALAEDAVNPNRTGLARMITVHIDKVEAPAARKRLAELLVARGGTDAEFSPYARTLQESSDSEVSRLAREKLK